MSEISEPPVEAQETEAVETQPEPVETQEQTPSPAPAGTPAERGPDVQVLFVTDLGYGVRTTLAEFRKAHRGTKGTRAMFLNEKNGNLVGAKLVNDGDVVTVMTKKGQAGLFAIDQVRLTGRGLSGVRLVTLEEGDIVVGIV